MLELELFDIAARWLHLMGIIVWIGHNYASIVTSPTYKPASSEAPLEVLGKHFEAALQREHGIFRYASLGGTGYSSGFYKCSVAQEVRSSVNVCFQLPSPGLEREFLFNAQKNGLLNLKGHSASGGIRASLYNAVSEEAVTALTRFMNGFAVQNGAAVDR
ncbi:MAG: hypothetical protein GY792_18605 [Gammaproteobacteria bacterium]|nr:hypothetical protein [Gammaproteobacteria bacterium]